MPSYEFRCKQCAKRFEIFIPYAEYDSKTVICPHCQSTEVQRRIGRVRVARASTESIDSLADSEQLAGLEDDPREMGRRLRAMSRETGEELGPEFDEVVGRLEAGQDPEQIEQDLPDLGSDLGSADDVLGGMEE